MKLLPITGIFLMLAALPLGAQSAADRAAIRATALDYIEGWYEGDAERMRRALHPELAKRIVVSDRASGRSRLEHMDAELLVRATRGGGGRETPVDSRRKEVRILDVFENAASARVTAADWVDFMHLARFEGRWVIVNVLWERTAAGS